MSTPVSHPERETELTIACQIEAQPEYQLGKPISVRGILRNSGTSTLWILRRNTFLQPHGGDCLSVSHNGAPVPYVGISVFHAVPCAESYLRILASESVEAQIDLSENYPIRESGDYEVSIHITVLGIVEEGDAEPPRNPDRLKLAQVESNKVTFRVGGSGSTLPITRPETPTLSSQRTLADYPSKPVQPKFDGLTDQEQKAWYDAHLTAYRQILAALKTAKMDQPADLYRRWFDNRLGQGWATRKETVINRLGLMVDWMANFPILYCRAQENCTFDLMAWTYKNAHGPINLCSGSFNDFMLFYTGGLNGKAWTRDFIAIHEISHAAANTEDVWYSWFRCQSLPVDDPDVAVNNAQSYALFAMDVDTSQLPYEPEGTFDLKTGDQVALKANNGSYLANRWHYSGGNYIEAVTETYTPGDSRFTVVVDDHDLSKIYLQRDDKTYLSDDGGYGYIQPNKTTPDDSCVFQVGEFQNHKNEISLILQSSRGKLWCQIDDYPNYIVAKEPNVNQWCLFQLIKL